MKEYEQIAKRYKKASLYLYKVAFVFIVLFLIVLLFFKTHEYIYRIFLIISVSAFVQGGMLKILSHILTQKE